MMYSKLGPFWLESKRVSDAPRQMTELSSVKAKHDFVNMISQQNKTCKHDFTNTITTTYDFVNMISQKHVCVFLISCSYVVLCDIMFTTSCCFCVRSCSQNHVFVVNSCSQNHVCLCEIMFTKSCVALRGLNTPCWPFTGLSIGPLGWPGDAGIRSPCIEVKHLLATSKG